MNTDRRSTAPLSGETQNRYKRDLALIRTLTAVVTSSLETDQVLKLSLRTILEWLGPDFAGMILLTERRGRGLDIAAHQGLLSEQVPGRVFIDECPSAKALETGMPSFERECPGHGCRVTLPDHAEHSHLSFPLHGHQTVVGAACIFCPADFQIDILNLSLWEDVGRLIGRAVEEASLNARLQQQQELLQTLYAVSDHLATSLDLGWVLGRVLELSVSATEGEEGTVFLLPSAGATARILRRDLTPEEADWVIEQVINHGLAGWVVRHKTGAIVMDASQDPRWLFFEDDPNPPGSALAVPLMADDEVLGVLTLGHPEPEHFQDRHLILMVAIAHQASAAVEKARLYKEVSNINEILEQRVEERTRELRETQAQLIHAEKLAALGELAAGVAHEINNPLHILQAYLDYMATKIKDSPALLELLEPMRSSLESIARLTTQLRDFSRPALGERKPVNLNDILAKVLRLASKELMHSKVKVREVLATDLPSVLGDSRQLEQVFLNLILNARDAMPGGGDLTITTGVNGGDVYASFADTGIGVAPGDEARIFEPYFTTKEDRGTGLGLAICQRIARQHAGTIRVKSELGRGAEFTVQLPAAPETLE